MYIYTLGDMLNGKNRMILKPELHEAERLVLSTRSPVANGRLVRTRVFPTWNTEYPNHTAFGDSEAPYTPYCETKGNYDCACNLGERIVGYVSYPVSVSGAVRRTLNCYVRLSPAGLRGPGSTPPIIF